MSRDSNHFSVLRWFSQRGAGVIDLSNIGGGVPDALVSFAGVERLVETKVERPPKGVRHGLLSTKCANCHHERRKHADESKNLPGGVMVGLCMGGSRLKQCRCVRFVPDYGERKSPGGVVSARQKAWARSWPGHPPVVVRTESDVERVLDEMQREGDRRQSVA